MLALLEHLSKCGRSEPFLPNTVSPPFIIAFPIEVRPIAETIRGSVLDKELPLRFHRARCLTDAMIGALWQTVAQIDQHFGKPVDIEWVIEPNWRPGIPISVVQVRPITTLAEATGSDGVPKWDPLGYAGKYGLGLKPKSSTIGLL
jgi:phosphoenolpyruvate synthase/pyruvate phosphate dikinase